MSVKWSIAPLGEIFTIARGGSPRPIDYYITESEDGINWIMIADAVEGTKYIRSTKKKIRRAGMERSRLVKPGDFLLTNSMSFGKPYILQTEGCIHDGWLVLSPRGANVCQDYFYHLLGSDVVYSEFAKRASGAVVKNLNIDLVKGVEVPYPPLSEQKRIAAILDKADAIRRKRQQALRLSDDFLRSVFLDMFGDTSKHGWQMLSVTDMLAPKDGAMRTGPFGSQLLHSEFVDEGIAVLGIDNAVKNEFRWGKPRFITEAKYEEMQRYTVMPGDVIITIMGTVGRCAIVPDDIPTAINTKHLCCITLDHEKCLPEFLHAYFLTHPVARKYLASTAKGAIMDGLNMGIIKALPVPQVPLRLQGQYRDLVRAHSKMKVRLTDHQATSEMLFSSLQQRAFSGLL